MRQRKMNLNSKSNPEQNKKILDLIEQKNNENLKWELKYNFKKNSIEENFYKLAFKTNNIEAFEILYTYDTKNNIKSVLNHNLSMILFIFTNEKKINIFSLWWSYSSSF